jgi:hypothetical protein
VRGAKQTINFETYIYWSGAVGKEFAEALEERARAGVKVHVLIDWVGSQKMEDTLVDEMKAAGIEVQLYHPLHWYNLGRMNNRTHRKLLVVDGRWASPAASASPTSGTAGAGSRPLARLALPPGRARGAADAGGVPRQLDQDHRQGAAGREYFPRSSRRRRSSPRCSPARPAAAATAWR